MSRNQEEKIVVFPESILARKPVRVERQQPSVLLATA